MTGRTDMMEKINQIGGSQRVIHAQKQEGKEAETSEVKEGEKKQGDEEDDYSEDQFDEEADADAAKSRQPSQAFTTPPPQASQKSLLVNGQEDKLDQDSNEELNYEDDTFEDEVNEKQTGRTSPKNQINIADSNANQ